MNTPTILAEWLRELLRDATPAGADNDRSLQGGVEFRSVGLGGWKDHRAGGIPSLTHRPLAENERRLVLVTTAEQLFDKIVGGLSALARYAADHCGADGDVVVSASPLPLGRVEATVAASAHILSGMRQTPGTHELQRAVVGHHTLPLRAMHTPSTEMMVADTHTDSVRMQTADLVGLSDFTEGNLVEAEEE